MRGFSLIEVVIFIVIMGISVALLLPLITSLSISGSLPHQTVAQQLAQARMALIAEQRYIAGFSSFVDPCTTASPPAVCTPPTGYTVSATISNNWNGDAEYKVITVTVGGNAAATLTQLVANYE